MKTEESVAGAGRRIVNDDQNGGIRCWRRSENSWETGAENRRYTTYSGAGPPRKIGPAPLRAGPAPFLAGPEPIS